MTISSSRYVSASLLAALLSISSSVEAGGFATARFGAENGNAASDSPTSIYYNPAGLALGHGTRVLVEGLFAFRSITYDRPEGAIDNVVDGGGEAGTPIGDGVAANSGSASLSNFVASPFLGIVSDFGVPNLGVGFAVYAPFGGQASWDRNEAFEDSTMYPGAVDGVQRWSTIEGTLREVYFTIGGAYKLPGPGLSFGVGLNVDRSSLDTVRARLTTGTDHLIGGTGDLAEGRSRITVSGTHLAVGAGVAYEPTDSMLIGLSYQSQPGFGERAQKGQLINKFSNSATTSSDIDFVSALPDIVRFGVRYRPTTRSEVRLSGDFQRWSVLQNQCLIDGNDPDAKCSLNENGGTNADSVGVIVNIPRRWQDTYGVKGGASYWIMPDFELTGGLLFDTNAVPDEMIDASLIDMNKMSGTLGVRSAVLNGAMTLSLSWTQVFYFERTVAPRERDDMDVAIGPENPSRVPDGAGTYTQSIGFATVGAEYAF